MDVIVASGNLFRLELSAYLLSEAGYTVHEFADLSSLLGALGGVEPAVIVLDGQLISESLPTLLQQVAQHSAARTLLIANSAPTAEARQYLAIQGGSVICWPYQNDDLISSVRSLHTLQQQVVGQI